MKTTITIMLLALSLSLYTGCSNTMKPIPTVKQVDLPRFMGDWYVIANIPTFLEKGAHNAVENYELKDDGRIATTFTFNAGGFAGERKQYNPTGFIVDKQNNASWDMQFLWPFKAEYKVVYLDEQYQQTIIGRSKRDYIWIMAREPVMSEAEYQKLLGVAEGLGYDTGLIERVPQRWGEDKRAKKNPPRSPFFKGGGPSIDPGLGWRALPFAKGETEGIWLARHFRQEGQRVKNSIAQEPHPCA